MPVSSPPVVLEKGPWVVNPPDDCLDLRHRIFLTQIGQSTEQLRERLWSKMPFFRESFDGDDVRRPVPAAETLSRPFPIQGLAQLTRQALAGRLSRRTSEESIRTDLCDGPVPDALGVPESMSPRPGLCATTTSDRAELIERLKKGESPTWIPNRRVC